jgi:uncharacterized protein
LRKSLTLLDELQQIDLKIDGFNGEKDRLLAEMAQLDTSIEEAEAAISVKNNELMFAEDERIAIDENLIQETENIDRSEQRLKDIKTQKEYQAVSKEITTARKLKAELEEQLAEKLTRLDEQRSEIAALRENLSSLEENITTRKSEVQAAIDSLEGGITQDITDREEIVKELPASIMRRYSQLREQRRGIAVVEARNGSCLGCNMNLPPQLYNTLFRYDELIVCPHCQRMLVLHQEQK